MTQLFDLNARIQRLMWSLIFYEKYSTSLSTIVLVVLTTANFGGFSNFCRYYTRSQAGKSTRYRPTLKPLYKVLYKFSSFRPIPPTNMVAKGNSCFWLANVKKIFSSETAWPNGSKLGRKHLCKILYKTSSFGSIRPTNMAAVTKNRTYGKIGNN